MHCTHAIIAVGGVGSRMLPWGYSGEKSMLPVIDQGGQTPVIRPVIDFIVQDCIEAGITDITFIVGEGAQAIRKHYQGNEPVDRYFVSQDKAHLLNAVGSGSQRVTFRFIEQKYGSKYGTTVPISLARDIIREAGQALYIYGDQFFYGGGSEARRLLEGMHSVDAQTGMLVLPIAPERVGHYGIVEHHEGLLERIIEKPAVSSVASTDANVGIFAVDTAILPFIEANMQRSLTASGEHYFTDVITALATAGTKVAVVRAAGTYLDCGTPENWLATNNFMAQQV